MKRLFFLLVLINLGLAGWGYFLVRPKPATLPPLIGGGNLKLLSERDTGGAKPAQPGYDLEHLPSARAAVPEPPAPQASASPPGPQSQPGAPPATAPPETAVPLVPASATLASTELPEPPAKPAPKPETSQNAKLLTCHALGAFDKREDAERVAGELASVSVAATLREDISQRENGFWVLIPPLPSRDAARAMDKRLRDAGIEDTWRIIKGDLENAVSLGLFSKREAAERRKQEIVGRGFAAEVRPRITESDQFWLDFPADTKVDATALKSRFAHDFPDLQLLQRKCVRVNTP